MIKHAIHSAAFTSRMAVAGTGHIFIRRGAAIKIIDGENNTGKKV